MIELKQGMMPLTEDSPEIRNCALNTSEPGFHQMWSDWMDVVARYLPACESESIVYRESLLLLDQICQQAAQAQAIEAELVRLKAINDFGRVVRPALSEDEIDAVIDDFAENGAKPRADVRDAETWKRELCDEVLLDHNMYITIKLATFNKLVDAAANRGGKTLRDELAMEVMKKMLEFVLTHENRPGVPVERIAKQAYALADAMQVASK